MEAGSNRGERQTAGDLSSTVQGPIAAGQPAFSAALPGMTVMIAHNPLDGRALRRETAKSTG